MQMVQQVLTDAKLNDQNIHYLFVDFSSASNTIDHDRLLVIMHDLGIPQDCIEVIRDLTTEQKLVSFSQQGSPLK
jgi:hypothetical protein